MNQNLRILSECDHWLMDGTFNISPTIFNQVYIIIGLFSKNENKRKLILPFVFAFFIDKKINTPKF